MADETTKTNAVETTTTSGYSFTINPQVQAPCPTCGKCPTCGSYSPAPWYPVSPINPWWEVQPHINTSPTWQDSPAYSPQGTWTSDKIEYWYETNPNVKFTL